MQKPAAMSSSLGEDAKLTPARHGGASLALRVTPGATTRSTSAPATLSLDATRFARYVEEHLRRRQITSYRVGAQTPPTFAGSVAPVTTSGALPLEALGE